MNSRPRPRDAADTRRRILDAATEEFSARGLAGARVMAIAERALANQRMIYAYFESKEGLFKAVIERAVLVMQDTVALDPGDLVEYAQAVFDAYKAHPYLVRLALWQGLELPELSTTITPIAEATGRKVAAIRRAQDDGILSGALDAKDLLDAILTLVYGNLVLAGDINSYTPERRAALSTAVALLAQPR
jgi:AcrR family transcriptional regulator